MSFLSNKSVRYGLPFIILVVGGSFGLKQFTSLKYEYGKAHQTKFIKDIAKERGIPLRDPSEVTLEAQFKKIQEEVDIEHWENKRGPRPWEENNELYEEALKRSEKIAAERRLQS